MAEDESARVPAATGTQVLVVTGHRPDKVGGEYGMRGPWSDHVRGLLREQIRTLHPHRAISGMAMGVDLLFAQVVLEAEIPLVAAIPFESWSDDWGHEAKAVLREILDHPLTSTHLVTTGPGNAYKYQRRNEWMVDRAVEAGPKAGVLLAVWNGSRGGTANCVAYAMEVGLEIIYLDPKPPGAPR